MTTNTRVSPEPSVHRLVGQTALVTGAARGIGRAIAERLAAEGAHVAVLDLNAAGVAETCAQITAAGGSARAFSADITNRQEIVDAVESIVAESGRLDILVNNAGIGRPALFLEMTDEDWDRILTVNLKGYFVVTQAVARRMVEQGGGRIVNIASLAAHMANDRQAAYAAAKAGVVALTQVLAFELAPQGVSVNAVSPGPIATELAASMLTPAARRAREERIPVGRLGEPTEVAAAVAFLASADASYVNGTVLVVDGGLLTAGIRS